MSLNDISTFRNNAESGNCDRTQPAKRQPSPDSASVSSAGIGWLETRSIKAMTLQLPVPAQLKE